jgi:hypothetical protein
MEKLDKGSQGPISGCCAIEEEKEEDLPQSVATYISLNSV